MKPALPVLLFLIALTFTPNVCFARPQQESTGPDPVILSAARAMHEGRKVDAEKILSDAIRQFEKSEPNSPQLASYLEMSAGLLDQRQQRQRSEAIALTQRALAINEGVFGPTDQTVEYDLFDIGDLLRLQGEIEQDTRRRDEAESTLKQALEIARVNPMVSDLERFEVLDDLADIYRHEHRWMEAEQSLLEVKQGCTALTKNYGPCSWCQSELENLYFEERNAPGR